MVEATKTAGLAVRNEIIVGFVETHMCVWPDSELEDVVKHMLNQDYDTAPKPDPGNDRLSR